MTQKLPERSVPGGADRRGRRREGSHADADRSRARDSRPSQDSISRASTSRSWPATRARPGPCRYEPGEGSNNWVVDGTLSASGKPLLASDPHRAIGLPSLRYLVHLNAPGWNVIGSGEPAPPGVAIGHNERIAWGFTIVGTDQADLYVEETDPEDPTRYKVGDAGRRCRSSARRSTSVARPSRSSWSCGSRGTGR